MTKYFGTTKRKVMLVLGVALVLFISWYTISANSETRTSRAFRAMPDGSVQVVNDHGDTITLQLKIADTPDARSANFKNTGVQTIQENAVLLVYRTDSSERHNVRTVKAPLEIGFFRADGSLAHISRTRVGSNTSYGTTGAANRYRYALMAPQGYFAKHSISIDGGAVLLPDTLRR